MLLHLLGIRAKCKTVMVMKCSAIKLVILFFNNGINEVRSIPRQRIRECTHGAILQKLILVEKREGPSSTRRLVAPRRTIAIPVADTEHRGSKSYARLSNLAV